MIKKPILPERIRKIEGSFAFIPHRFLRAGFWENLDQYELLLYILLVMVADRHGLSYYSYDKLCSLLGCTVDEYIQARDNLIDQNLLAFDGRLFQVLSLPEAPAAKRPHTPMFPEGMNFSDPSYCYRTPGRTL